MTMSDPKVSWKSIDTKPSNQLNDFGIGIAFGCELVLFLLPILLSI